MSREVLDRALPVAGPAQRALYTLDHSLGGRASENVAPDFDRLGTLRNIADDDIGDLKDAALFLHGPAVRQHAKGLLLHGHEVRETQGLDVADRSAAVTNSKRLQFAPRARVETANDWEVVFATNHLQAGQETPQALLLADVFRPVQRDEKVFVGLDLQPRMHVAPVNRLAIGLEHLVDRIADYVDARSLDSLTDEVLLAPVRIR